jgi:hypothetical protein
MMIRMRIRYRYGIRMRIVGNEGMRRRRKGWRMKQLEGDMGMVKSST